MVDFDKNTKLEKVQYFFKKLEETATIVCCFILNRVLLNLLKIPVKINSVENETAKISFSKENSTRVIESLLQSLDIQKFDQNTIFEFLQNFIQSLKNVSTISDLIKFENSGNQIYFTLDSKLINLFEANKNKLLPLIKMPVPKAFEIGLGIFNPELYPDYFGIEIKIREKSVISLNSNQLAERLVKLITFLSESGVDFEELFQDQEFFAMIKEIVEILKENWKKKKLNLNIDNQESNFTPILCLNLDPEAKKEMVDLVMEFMNRKFKGKLIQLLQSLLTMKKALAILKTPNSNATSHNFYKNYNY